MHNGSIYGTVYVATRTSSEGSMSCMKDQLYGNSTCTKRNCQKEPEDKCTESTAVY